MSFQTDKQDNFADIVSMHSKITSLHLASEIAIYQAKTKCQTYPRISVDVLLNAITECI